MEIKQKTLLESENGLEQIFEYIRIKILLRTNIRIYSYPKKWHERISEYIRIQKMIRTNIRMNIRIKNIRVFEYSNIFVTLWTEETIFLNYSHPLESAYRWSIYWVEMCETICCKFFPDLNLQKMSHEGSDSVHLDGCLLELKR